MPVIEISVAAFEILRNAAANTLRGQIDVDSMKTVLDELFPEPAKRSEDDYYLTIENLIQSDDAIESQFKQFGVRSHYRSTDLSCICYVGPRENLGALYQACFAVNSDPSWTLFSLIPPLMVTIELAKQQVLKDVRAGYVRSSTASFSELDDQRDANCYGDLAEDYLFDALMSHYCGRDELGGMPQGMFDYVESVRSALNVWLIAGGASSH